MKIRSGEPSRDRAAPAVLATLPRPVRLSKRRIVARPAGQPVRRRTQDLRFAHTLAVAELVASRRDFLPRQEQALLEQVFVLGRPLGDIAALTGEPVRTVRRRVKELVERLNDPGFEAATKRHAGWPSQMAAIGAAVFVRGLSVRAAAEEVGISYHAAREHARVIRAIGVELRHKEEAA